MRIGIDIGSTTVKVVVLDDSDRTIFKTYERHMSKVREKTAEMLERLADFYQTSVDYLLDRTEIPAPYPKP